MRVLFFGTPGYTVPYLESISRDHEICGIITAPDRPAGRGRSPRKPAPGIMAGEKGIPLFQPEKLGDAELRRKLRKLKPDIGVIVAYGKIIPEEVYSIPASGCFNIHFSLLPAYRGASPVESALLNGEERTGVSMQRITAELDAGDLLASREISVPDSWHYPELIDALLEAGIALLADGLRAVSSGRFTLTPQNESRATFCSRIRTEDRNIPWEQDARSVRGRIRAFSGLRTAVTMMDGTRYFIHRASLDDSEERAPAGTVLQCDRHGFRVACGSGVIRILEIQRENKKRMDAISFANGNSIRPGNRFSPEETT